MARKAIPGTVFAADSTAASTRLAGNVGVSLRRAAISGALPGCGTFPPDSARLGSPTVPPCGKPGIGAVPDLFPLDAPMPFLGRLAGNIVVSCRRGAVFGVPPGCETFSPNSNPPGSSMMPPYGKSGIGVVPDLFSFDTPMTSPDSRRLGNVGFPFRRGADGVLLEYEALRRASGRCLDALVASGTRSRA